MVGSPQLNVISNYSKQQSINFVVSLHEKTHPNIPNELIFVKSKLEAPDEEYSVDYKKLIVEVRSIAMGISKPEFLISKKTRHVYGIYDASKKKFYYYKSL